MVHEMVEASSESTAEDIEFALGPARATSRKRKGRHPMNALTPAVLRAPLSPGMYADGNGLYLRVDDSGARRWVQRIVFRGKRHSLGLGGFPTVTLREARHAAYENKRAVQEGRDPFASRRAHAMPTFREAAAAVIALRRPVWQNAKHAAQWTATLETYAFPVMGHLPVGTITVADVLRVLTPIWTTKAETARRLRQRIRTVLNWAVAHQFCEQNAAGDALEAVLPRISALKRHHRALPYAEVPQALQTVLASSSSASIRLSFAFLVLTAARSGEVRYALWEEIDTQSRTWTIPASRMKAAREHRVPLSGRAIEDLRAAAELNGGGGLIFPSPVTGGPLSNNTHRQMLADLGIAAVPHGFRSSFRDWAAERTDASHAVMEASLAHVVANSTEAAYFRSDLFEKRRTLMDQWAEYLLGPGA